MKANASGSDQSLFDGWEQPILDAQDGKSCNPMLLQEYQPAKR
jgi:hypothetical protein